MTKAATKVIYARVPLETYELFRQQAERIGRSLNEHLIRVLNQALRREKK